MKLTKESQVTFDNKSIIVDGKRCFPVMGEMHFSRYPHKYWKEELFKIKSGGVDIVSLYTIWIHHEETEGEFDFTGDKNLRAFLEDVQRTGLYCFLRIGPWAHGEARNGGFPDWLLDKEKTNGFRTRTNDEEYLHYVKTFYEKIFEQVKGLFIKDGGPIIGIQIENEYGHVGGQTGEEGEEHMKTLYNMAREIGFDAPLWTATGWGGAVTGGLLPVMGGYCEAPWDQRLTEIEPSGNYVFTPERNDHNIASDHGLGYGITFDMNKFPYLTAELGGGLQVTEHRRPVASSEDIGAMSLAKLGSGCNLLGYYMYHGGTNPYGKYTTLMESKETGYPNDLPVLSYDFNAPIKEYGQLTDTYREIRLLSSFVHDFGSDLCDMNLVMQKENSENPEDLETLRTSVRYHKEEINNEEIPSGYLFVNNYQRRYEMASHKGVELKAYDENEKVLVNFPGKINIENGDYFFLPFNMKIGEKALLKTAFATPFCILNNSPKQGKKTYVFYKACAAKEPSFDIKGDLDGNIIAVISRNEALYSQKITISGKDYLVFSENDIVLSENGYDMLVNVNDDEGFEEPEVGTFYIYPDLNCIPESFHKVAKEIELGENLRKVGFINMADFTEYAFDYSLYSSISYNIMPKAKIMSAADNSKEAVLVKDKERNCYNLHIEGIEENMEDVFLRIGYSGNHGGMFGENDFRADSFYTGQKWEIGLKRFLDRDCKLHNTTRRPDTFSAEFAITPLYENAPKYLQSWPEMENGKACRIDSLEVICQYRIKLL